MWMREWIFKFPYTVYIPVISKRTLMIDFDLELTFWYESWLQFIYLKIS